MYDFKIPLPEDDYNIVYNYWPLFDKVDPPVAKKEYPVKKCIKILNTNEVLPERPAPAFTSFIVIDAKWKINCNFKKEDFITWPQIHKLGKQQFDDYPYKSLTVPLNSGLVWLI